MFVVFFCFFFISIFKLIRVNVHVVKIWVWLFKTYNVFSEHFIKISNLNISYMPVFFVEKLCEAFALHCKSFSHFSTKNMSLYV